MRVKGTCQSHILNFRIWNYIRICLGVLRTLDFYINFHQSAINGHKYCVLSHTLPTARFSAQH